MGALLRDATAAEQKSRLVWNEDLGTLPRRIPLVGDFLGVGEIAWLYGPPGSFKTFAGIDLAASIATGRPGVFGEPFVTGRVVYLLAEGSTGLDVRVRAWEKRHGTLPTQRVAFFPAELNLLRDADVDALIADVKATVGNPVLFIVDPLAEFLGGGDENASGVILPVIRSLKRLHREFGGAAVVVIAHCGHDLRHERGHSSQRGATDVTVSFRATGEDRATVRCEKRRHRSKWPPFTLTRHVVPVPELGDDADSCVLERIGGPAVDGLPSPRALGMLARLADGPLTFSKWRAEDSERTFSRVRGELLNAGYITKEGRHYTLTERGRAAILPKHCHGSLAAASETTAITATPPLGVAGGSNGSLH